MASAAAPQSSLDKLAAEDRTATDRAASEPQLVAARRAMIDSQLRPSGISEASLLEAMGRLPREDFVAAGQRAIAYMDRALPLGGGRMLSAPLTQARLLQEARPRRSDRALLIGGGSGYLAALLAPQVASLTVVEPERRLREMAPPEKVRAEKVMAEMATAQTVTTETGSAEAASAGMMAPRAVHWQEAPLAEGWAAGAPYDLIVIDGAAECIPDAIAIQLTPDGRLVTGVVQRGVTRLAIGRGIGPGVEHGVAQGSGQAEGAIPGRAGGTGRLALQPLAEIGFPVLEAFAAPRKWSF